MSAEQERLLILANCGRSMAESARRGGYQVSVLDAFCDHDTLAVADCWPVSQGFSHLNVDMFLNEMKSIFPHSPSGIVYGAGLEGASYLLQQLSSRYPLYGNDPAVLDVLRRPQRFFSLLNRLRIPYPEVCFTPPYADIKDKWLIKRAGSCGGQGVAFFDPHHSAADASCYYQRHTHGQVMSVLFIADGERARIIGFNRLRMRASNAPAPFLYSGAISQVQLHDSVRHDVIGIVDKLVGELSLRGVNSLDFILNEEGVWVIDLNPRPTATLELYEHLIEEGWIKQHIRACQGELPVLPIIGSTMTNGHMIVYAPRTLEIPVEMRWPAWIKDRPLPRARITQGQPLCSLFAEDISAEKVEARLAHRQEEILSQIGLPAKYKQPERVAV